jgi:protease I
MQDVYVQAQRPADEHGRRRATSVGAIRDDMVNAGADWVDEATVVDGNLISARTPADLGPWMKALLKAIELKALAIG